MSILNSSVVNGRDQVVQSGDNARGCISHTNSPAQFDGHASTDELFPSVGGVKLHGVFPSRSEMHQAVRLDLELRLAHVIWIGCLVSGVGAGAGWVGAGAVVAPLVEAGSGMG